MRRLRPTAACAAAMAAAGLLGAAQAAPVPAPAPDATVVTPPLTIPYSVFASPQAQTRFAKLMAERRNGPQPGPDIASQRRFYGAYNDARLAEMRRLFSTTVEHRTLGGVPVDVVTPSGGVPPAHRDKVLINLHGGAFMWGAGSGALVEAIPIAAVGGYTVVAVDYRLAPEHRFPAAVEDAAAVYRALLKDHRAADIGIYGCSAGGILTAEAEAWFQTHGLPNPGALGTSCGSGLPLRGDSITLAAAATGDKPPFDPDPLGKDPYLLGTKPDDPLVYPGLDPAMLARFPPTLLITGSRDFTASSTETMARRLASAGVDVDLQVFDGMWHGFFVFPDLPESQEAYRLIASFFDRELGHPAGSAVR